MDRVEAISKCRYYSGEEKCPFSTDALRRYWDMERVFVEHHGELDKEDDSFYRNMGGKEYPGIPRALLITMFLFWGNGTYDIKKGMPEFYKLIDDYLQVASDHFPKDKIPHNIK